MCDTKAVIPRSTPEEQGISSQSIYDWVKALDKLMYLNSFMLIRHGHVIAEGWWKPYNAETRHQTFSLSKSFTSVAVGLAISEKRLSLDDRVYEFFPDKLPQKMQADFMSMTVRHLLTMSTGHDRCAFCYVKDAPDGDWVKAFFNSPLAYEPGKIFSYNSIASYMLSAIITKLTKQKLVDYLYPRLLQPLGIEDYYWELCPKGINTGGWGFNLTMREIANFAQLLLQRGKWQGQQLIPEEYFEMATSFQIDNSMNENPDWKLGYGFQFWRCRHNAFRADGAFGQYALIMPDQDMTLTVTAGLQGMQEILNLVWDILLPAVKDIPLPSNPSDLNKLNEQIASLYIPLANGTKNDVPKSMCYNIEMNTLGISSIEFEISNDQCDLIISRGEEKEKISAGFGKNILGKFRLYNPIPCKVGASAGWKNSKELEIVFCFYETPYRVVFNCYFDGQNICIMNSSELEFLTFSKSPISVWPPLKGKLTNSKGSCP